MHNVTETYRLISILFIDNIMGPLLLNPEPAQTCRLYTGTSHGKPVAATAKLPGSQLASHSHQMHTHYGTLNCPFTDFNFLSY